VRQPLNSFCCQISPGQIEKAKLYSSTFSEENQRKLPACNEVSVLLCFRPISSTVLLQRSMALNIETILSKKGEVLRMVMAIESSGLQTQISCFLTKASFEIQEKYMNLQGFRHKSVVSGLQTQFFFVRAFRIQQLILPNPLEFL
jgi:hypothetical protein